jgi:hypothetical protein
MRHWACAVIALVLLSGRALGFTVEPIAEKIDTPEALRAALAVARQKVLDKTLDKLEAAQEAQLDRIGTALEIFSLGGLLLLGAPLVLRRRFPGRTLLLFKYSALAAGTFVVAVNLFSVALLGLRSARGALGPLTNPQVAAVEGTFATLDKNAAELTQIGPALLGPTLAQLDADGDEPLHVVLLDNLKKLGPTASVFVTIGKLFKSVDSLAAAVPIALSLLAVVLFLRSFWPVLREIIRMPAHAASGERPPREILRATFGTIGRELLAALALVGVLLVVTLVGGFVLFRVVEPAMEAILAFIVSAFLYLQVDPDASAGLLLLSMGGVALFLALNVAIVAVASGLYLARAQGIFRARFHDRVPLSSNAPFWKLGTLSLLWALALPLLFTLAAVPGIKAVFGAFLDGEHPSFLAAMGVSAVLLAGGLALAFWALRAGKGLRFIMTYQPAAQLPRRAFPPARVLAGA